MRQIVLDTETTGLEPAQGHRIIEIGCVELADRRLTGNDLHLYIHPDRDIDQGAIDVHGITLEFLDDKPRFHEQVCRLVSEGLLVGKAAQVSNLRHPGIDRLWTGTTTAGCVNAVLGEHSGRQVATALPGVLSWPASSTLMFLPFMLMARGSAAPDWAVRPHAAGSTANWTLIIYVGGTGTALRRQNIAAQSALSPGIALAHDLGPLCCLQLTGLAIAAE